MIILENGERADTLWGMDTEIITDEMIEALQQGKRLYLSVNDEYAVVIKKNGKRKTDNPEATDTDTISRQKVISTINVLRTRCDTDDIDDYHDLLVEAIEVLPPSPSRPKGRWKTIAFLTAECSECHAQIHELEYGNFCPNCGADMRP